MQALPFRYIGWLAAVALAVIGLDAAAQTVPKVMMAQCSVDSADAAITVGKAEAALGLTIGLSGRAAYIPMAARDSILESSTVAVSQRTVLGAASIVDARYVVFMNVRRLHHLVRSELVVVDATNPGQQRRGVGYSTLRHHHADETVLADPSVLAATQRAYAVAMGDSSMFTQPTIDSALHVVPADLAAVGGITFTNDADAQPWELFKQKVAVSYDIAQMIAHGLANASKFTVVDIETRDTMYAMLGLHLTENYNQVSAIELQQLGRFEVTHLVTGTLQRTVQGAVLTLTLNRITANERFTPLRSVEDVITEDTKVALRATVERAVARLFGE